MTSNYVSNNTAFHLSSSYWTGLSQGGTSPPYIFLQCVEIMGLKVRE